MIDDLERRMRDQLRRLRLPEAPPTLHAEIANLATDVNLRRPRDSRRAPLLLVAAATVLTVAAGAFVLGGSPDPTPSPEPSPTAADGVVSFAAPGISLELPNGWSDHSSLVAVGEIPGQRFIGMFARGMTPCTTGFYAPAATPQASCDPEPSEPGSALVTILEFTHPYPGMKLPGPALTIAGYSGWEREMGDMKIWQINSPDGGAYLFQLSAPADEAARVAAETRAILATLKLSPWEPPPVAVAGLIHEEADGVFSFDYPAEWVRYYPVGWGVVTVASDPLLPPCDSDNCQRFSTPPGTVAIEFQMGGGPTSPDWGTAPTRVAGRPAFTWDWGSEMVTSADEGHQWSVRLTDTTTLGIVASLRGPDLAGLTAAMNQVIASIRIDPEPAATP